MFDLLMRVLVNSAVMSFAVLILYGLARLTRGKVSPRVRHICWVVIAVGLLLPVRPALFTVSVNLPNLPEPMAQTDQQRAFATFVNPGSFEPLYPAEPEAGYNITGYTKAGYTEPYTAFYGASPTLSPTLSYEPVHAHSYAPSYMAAYPAAMRINWRILLPAVWLAGMSVFLAVFVTRHALFMKMLRRRAKPLADAYAVEMLAALCRGLGLRRPPLLYVCPLTASPIVTGLRRPVIILPEGPIEPERLRLMLLHELLHIKNGDIWTRLILLAATAAHWFNPLVYLMNRAAYTESELACDEAVLKYAGEETRFVYGETILNTARRAQFLSGLASAMSGGGKSLKRRLANIIERKHTRRGIAITCAVLMIGGVLLAGMISYNRAEAEGEIPEGGFVEDIGWEGDPDDPYDVPPPFVLEPTDELIIYLPAWQFFNPRFLEAVNVFRRRYPDVNLIVERVGDRYAPDGGREAYLGRVGPELMAGGGPDIILTHLFECIHKTMDSGMFMNLSTLWHRDEDFTHREELNQAVMDAGVYRGRRYLIPLGYTLPIMLGERGILDSLGFDPDIPMTTNTLFDAVMASVPAAAENPLFHFPVFTTNFFTSHDTMFGIPLMDFESGVVLPEEEALRAFIETNRDFWNNDLDWNDPFWRYANKETVVIEGRMILYPRITDPIGIFWSYSRMLYRGYTPVLSMIPNHNGEAHAVVQQSVAIRANSPNYVNAWKFIRLLLTANIQYGRIGTMDGFAFTGFGVNNAAVYRQVSEMLQEGTMVGTSEGNLYAPALTMEQKQPLLDMLAGITSASLPNYAVTQIYADAVGPFIEGRISLDDAMNELRRRLRIYLTE